MCLITGTRSRSQYEGISLPSRPVAPVYNAEKYEKPRRAPMVPPNSQARKRNERQVKSTLRDADKRPTPQPQPQQQQQQRAVKTTELGSTVPIRRTAARPVVLDESLVHPALRAAGKTYDQSDVDPAFRATSAFKPRDLRRPQPQPPPAQQTPARQAEQPRVHSSPLKTTKALELQTSLHPSLRNLQRTHAAAPRRVTELTRHTVERRVDYYLGSPNNYDDSPRELEVSPLNVANKLPYAAQHRRR
ncbi:hypothetical protein DHEL01_v203533 [Diaporthe helianthi]|uniref:Uncharacterized protein n=1 Tax=Diaporthe helianthi TaxID=158607 RepID=A0A2P5I6F1_DIAHE|nr:hypothetical protein DHEL01_v203533 [Diaporthe helianthi]